MILENEIKELLLQQAEDRESSSIIELFSDLDQVKPIKLYE